VFALPIFPAKTKAFERIKQTTSKHNGKLNVRSYFKQFLLYQTSVFEKNSLFLIKVEATPKLARYYIKVHSETKGPLFIAWLVLTTG